LSLRDLVDSAAASYGAGVLAEITIARTFCAAKTCRHCGGMRRGVLFRSEEVAASEGAGRPRTVQQGGNLGSILRHTGSGGARRLCPRDFFLTACDERASMGAALAQKIARASFRKEALTSNFCREVAMGHSS